MNCREKHQHENSSQTPGVKKHVKSVTGLKKKNPHRSLACPEKPLRWQLGGVCARHTGQTLCQQEPCQEVSAPGARCVLNARGRRCEDSLLWPNTWLFARQKVEPCLPVAVALSMAQVQCPQRRSCALFGYCHLRYSFFLHTFSAKDFDTCYLHGNHAV